MSDGQQRKHFNTQIKNRIGIKSFIFFFFFFFFFLRLNGISPFNRWKTKQNSITICIYRHTHTHTRISSNLFVCFFFSFLFFSSFPDVSNPSDFGQLKAKIYRENISNVRIYSGL